MDGPPSSLFRLASDWVYLARSVALAAVGSYPTFSPLPSEEGGMFSVALAVNSYLSEFPPLSWGILPCDVRTFLSGVRKLWSE